MTKKLFAASMAILVTVLLAGPAQATLSISEGLRSQVSGLK